MIEVAVQLTVYPAEDYYFDVTASNEELNIIVRESDKITQQVNFGSVEEMRAVAKAMLQACDLKEQK